MRQFARLQRFCLNHIKQDPFFLRLYSLITAFQQTYGFLPPMNYHEDEVEPDKLEEVEGEGSYEHKEDESEEPMIVYLELFKEKYRCKKPESTDVRNLRSMSANLNEQPSSVNRLVHSKQVSKS
ncbi:hypothetical protein RHGRI_021151 [Rhododendron griersonianum]|uniref:Uncharacterized protein n=1 Tax=Rhododendron griersonianum TaxID=479676 RepID=A0AAV6JMF4_9ERIC|nr:hypothetical protein RHGRI_021151 [Rhododendron griersonianum]